MISIIVAYDENRVMGKSGSGLLWHLPQDLKKFRAITMGNTVIMGRRTWDVLPKKPLPGRLNIVLSRQGVAIPDNAFNDTQIYVTDEIADAIRYANFAKHNRDIFVIGGLQVYQLALCEMPVQQIIVSQVHGQYDGDLKFPELGPEWQFRSFDKCEGFDHLVFSKGEK